MAKDDLKRKVVDYWLLGKEWDWEVLNDQPPEKALKDLSYYVLEETEEDEVY